MLACIIVILLSVRVFSVLCPINSSELIIYKDLAYCLLTIVFIPEVDGCSLPSDGMLVKLQTESWSFLVELTNIAFTGLISLRFTCTDIIEGGHPECMQELDGLQLFYVSFMKNIQDEGFSVPILHSISRVYDLAKSWTNPYFVLYSDTATGISKTCMHFVPRYIPLPVRVQHPMVCNITGTMSWVISDKTTVTIPLDDDFLQTDPILGLKYYNHTAITQVCATCTTSLTSSSSTCDISSSIIYGYTPNVTIHLEYFTGYLVHNEGSVDISNDNVQSLSFSSFGSCSQSDLVYICFWTTDGIVMDKYMRQYYFFREDAPSWCYTVMKSTLISSNLTIFYNDTYLSESLQDKLTVQPNPLQVLSTSCINRGFYNNVFWVEYDLGKFVTSNSYRATELTMDNIIIAIQTKFQMSNKKIFHLLHHVKTLYVPCFMRPQLVVYTNYIHFFFRDFIRHTTTKSCYSLLLPNYSHTVAINNLAVENTKDRSLNVCTSALNNTDEKLAYTSTITDIRLEFYEQFPFTETYQDKILLGDFYLSTLIPDTYFYQKKHITITCKSYVPAKSLSCWDLLREIRIQHRRNTLSVVIFFNDVPYNVSTIVFKETYLMIIFTVGACLVVGLLGAIYVIATLGIFDKKKDISSQQEEAPP
ncbi:Hypothetical protein GLP15_609 [Giardia lamblia P15]|uniref:Uncharacterized protein n=1 Tax=Giardia intestinalis (strain P15) TaxID=658858 RepID=E1F576_GIAIA|nr:Hypothetical protein GLP15_609 [Giardia lamblia P15]